RTGIYELLSVDESLRGLIHAGGDEQAMRGHAMQHGMVSLRADGFARVLAGETTLEEILRVTRED
ncbi:MAG: type II secretion system protein GspE, partial [Rhodoferax sp.]|nr:type II secretion system protein GspE [Rhodoferax sp.]